MNEILPQRQAGVGFQQTKRAERVRHLEHLRDCVERLHAPVVGEQTETGFQQTGAAKFLRRVSENFRTAFYANFSGSRH